MNATIALGVGHLNKIACIRTLEPNVDYPVYIAEPLMVLYLS
jgi:hypothetical protein